MIILVKEAHITFIKDLNIGIILVYRFKNSILTENRRLLRSSLTPNHISQPRYVFDLALVIFCRNYFPERLILHCNRRQLSHIKGGGQILNILQTMRAIKRSLRESILGAKEIHFSQEVFGVVRMIIKLKAADLRHVSVCVFLQEELVPEVLGECESGIVTRREHETVEQFFN